MKVLEVTGLHKSYESDGAPVRALRGVSLTMTGGEFVAIMGPSGCGKSTLLNLVAGLDSPTDGQIVLAGIPLADKDEERARPHPAVAHRHRRGHGTAACSCAPRDPMEGLRLDRPHG